MVERLQEAPIKYMFFKGRPDLILSEVWRAFFRDLRTIKSDRPLEATEGNVGIFDEYRNLEDGGPFNEIIDDRINNLLQEANSITLNYDDENNTLTIAVKIKDNSGISVDSYGLYIKLKTGYGIDVDSDGLKLKQQNHIADASAISAISLGAGADTVDRAAFNTSLGTLVTEINAIKTIVNSILTNLENAEINATS